MLLVFIVHLRRRTCFLAAFASNEDLAASFLFQSLLVETFGPNNHSNVVDPGVLWDINFLFQLVCFVDRGQGFVLVRLLVEIALILEQLFCDFVFICISPLVAVLATNWRFVGDHDVVVGGGGAVTVYFHLYQVARVVVRLQICAVDGVWTRFVRDRGWVH